MRSAKSLYLDFAKRNYYQSEGYNVKNKNRIIAALIAVVLVLCACGGYAGVKFINHEKNPCVLGQHRTMGAAGFGGSFAPSTQFRKWEIHKVFPHFQNFRLGQNPSPNLLAPLCGVALG